MKKIITTLLGTVLIISLVGTTILVWEKEQHHSPPPLVTFDATPLYTKLSECEKIKVIKINPKEGNKILYECHGDKDVTRVVDSIIVNTNGLKTVSLSIPCYCINFYRNDEVVVCLELRTSTIRWSQSSWEWRDFDFLLTDESYHMFISWFCEETGEPALAYPEYPSLRKE